MAESPVTYATSMLHLPDELLLQILRDIGPPAKEYLGVALTNRRLNRLSAEFLYAKHGTKTENPPRFLRTLVSRRDLAEHVNEINFWIPSEGYHLAPSTLPARVFLNPLEREKYSFLVSLTNAYNAASPDGLFIAIVLLTKNIRSLGVYIHNRDHEMKFRKPTWVRILTQVATGAAPSSVHGFHHLHTLRMSMESLSLACISNILLLPSLRNIELRAVDEREPLKWRYPARSSPITSVDIQESFIHSEALIQFLSSFKELKSFSYDQKFTAIWQYTLVEDVVLGFHYPNLIRALREHKSSLTRLALRDFTGLYDVREVPHHNIGPLPSLQEFSGLFRLTLPFAALPDAGSPDYASIFDYFPPNVKDVCITVESDEQLQNLYMTTMKDIALFSNATLPHFVKMKFGLRYPDRTDQKKSEALRALFSAHGITFEDTM